MCSVRYEILKGQFTKNEETVIIYLNSNLMKLKALESSVTAP